MHMHKLATRKIWPAGVTYQHRRLNVINLYRERKKSGDSKISHWTGFGETIRLDVRISFKRYCSTSPECQCSAV